MTVNPNLATLMRVIEENQDKMTEGEYLEAITKYLQAMSRTNEKMQIKIKENRYTHDDCGVKYRINPADDENDWIPCEPYCVNCGYPPHVCDEYYTRCSRTRCGRWFNEKQGLWVDAETNA